MRNFAHIIALETCDCLAYRVGNTDVAFRFRLRDEEHKQLLEPEVVMTWPHHSVAEALFDYRKDSLKEEAEKAYARIQDAIASQGL